MPTIIERREASNIIHALRRGEVPEQGTPILAVGLDAEWAEVARGLDRVASGQGDVKFVVGEYGSGKTFFLRYAAELAQTRGFVVAPATLTENVLLHNLPTVYGRWLTDLQIQGKRTSVLSAILDRWLTQAEDEVLQQEGLPASDPRLAGQIIRHLEQRLSQLHGCPPALTSAVRAYCLAVLEESYTRANAALAWLINDPGLAASQKREIGLKGSIQPDMVFPFLRALGELVQAVGYRGLLITLDELDITTRLPSDRRSKAFGILKEVVDGVDQGQFRFCYFLLSCTPNTLAGRKGICNTPTSANLAQRIRPLETPAGLRDLRGPSFALGRIGQERLLAISRRVRDLYALGVSEQTAARMPDAFFSMLMSKVAGGLKADIAVLPRVYLRELTHVLDLMDQNPGYDPIASYDLQVEQLLREIELRPEEITAESTVMTF